MTTPSFVFTCTVEDVDIRVVWAGYASLDVCVRPAGPSGDWQGWKTIHFPRDADGKHRFSFTAATFEVLSYGWMSRQFDLAVARSKAYC